MSCLDRLMREARLGLDPWQPTPADRAVRIGRQCGNAEIEAALARLDALSRERDMLPAWDGDTADDIWEAQLFLQRILENVPTGHSTQVMAGLRSPHAGTRMCAALALARHDRETVGPALRAALATDPDAGVRSILAAALARLEGKGSPDTSR